MQERNSDQQLVRTKAERRPRKLARLPPNAKVQKRALLHPQLASPYSGARQPKIIYVSAKSPFIAAVKRAEKLLQLSEKRHIQSATTLAKQNEGKRKRGEDEILHIAETLEAQKKKRKLDGGQEDEVVFKGTGKAIQKVLELGLWFQQREEYVVKLKSGSVGAVDDVLVEQEGYSCTPGGEAVHDEDMDGGGTTIHAAESTRRGDTAPITTFSKPNMHASEVKLADTIPETRIRHVSVLEVTVSLR